MFAKFIATTCLFFIGLALSICAMIHGWGLEPKSWWWILGVGVGLRFITMVMQDLVKKDDK